MRFLALPVVLVLLWSGARTPGVPDCFAPGGLAGALRNARAVFTARVLSSRRIERRVRRTRADSLRPPAPVVLDEVKLLVDSVWKGDVTTATTLYNATDGEAFPLRVGVRYLVFALRDADGSLYTHSCTATRRLPLTKAERRVLGSARRPTDRGAIGELKSRG